MEYQAQIATKDYTWNTQVHGISKKTWPAICDIWLGRRRAPVLAVAKEVAALQRWPRSRSGRAEDRSTTNCRETFCLVICLLFVWMFFFPSRSNNRLGLLIECSKLSCFVRENLTWFLGEEIDDRRRLLSGVLAGRRASWKRGQ